MVNGTTRGRDEERERRTEDMRDRKIDIGTRSAHTRASEKGVVDARGWRQRYGEEARGGDEEGSETLERERNI